MGLAFRWSLERLLACALSAAYFSTCKHRDGYYGVMLMLKAY